LSAGNYSFAQAPANATALSIVPVPVTPFTPQVAAVTSTVVAASADSGGTSGSGSTAGAAKSTTTAATGSATAALQLRSESGVADLTLASVAPASVSSVSAVAPSSTTPAAAPATTTSAAAVVGEVLAAASAANSAPAAAAVQAPAFNAVRLSSLSASELTSLLASRSGYTRTLFADSSSKLENNPGLADLKPCLSAQEAASGLCLITPALKAKLAAVAASGTPALTDAPTPAAPASSSASASASAPAITTAAIAPAAAPVFAAAPAAGRLAKVERAQRKVKSAALPQIQRKFALVLGVSIYQDVTIPPLANATRDATAVAAVLEAQLGYEAVVLEDASKAAVVAALNRIALTAGPRDSVIIYFAGHGELVETTKQGYWLLSDSVAQQPETWLSNADINRLVAQIGASQVALISDSCYSGSLASEERIRATSEALDPLVVLGRKSVVVMSSGGNQPVADDGRDGHSPFAWHLMDTLGKVNSWQAGGNIFERVRFAVARALPQRPQYSASRSAGHETGGEYLFEQRRLDAQSF
jgi:hypothetical protein